MKSDAKLKREVLAELDWEPGINAAKIGVIVENGVVTLSGYVNSLPEKWAAERAVKRVAGVEAVAEEIEVRIPADRTRTDADIARAAKNALEWNVSVPHDQVSVIVQDGWVTLEGEVGRWHQRQAAYDAVCNLTGVRGISNEITVKSKTTPARVKSKIKKALERNARIDSEDITVEVSGDKVFLGGSVRSWAEREEAEMAACAAPGVCQIENNIKVKADEDSTPSVYWT
jgi:osmotically-inducible protein OsmY